MTEPTFSFRAPADLMERLRRAAKAEQLTLGALIRRALTTELDRIDVLALARELAQRLGKDAA